MTTEVAAKAGREHAASRTHGGSTRLLFFVGASVAFHGVLALALLHGVKNPVVARRTALVSPQAGSATIWFEGTSGPPVSSVEASPKPRAITPEPSPEALRPRKKPVTVTAPRPDEAERGARPPASEPRAPPIVTEAEPTPAERVAAPDPERPKPGSASPPSEAEPRAAGIAEAVSGDSKAGAAGVGPASSGEGTGAVSSAAGAGSQSMKGPGKGAGAWTVAALKPYFMRLSWKVGRQRRYPESAIRLGLEGNARVRLRVRHDGSLEGAPELESSTGHEVLDAEALRMVVAAAPFAPLPEGVLGPDVELIVPIQFTLPSAR